MLERLNKAKVPPFNNNKKSGLSIIAMFLVSLLFVKLKIRMMRPFLPHSHPNTHWKELA